MLAILQTCKVGLDDRAYPGDVQADIGESWYTIAVAIFYTDVAVYDLASYLRGYDQSTLFPFIIPKASLLAQTRSLCVVPGQLHRNRQRDSRQRMQALAKACNMLEEADDLLSIIYRSTDPFPSLRCLQIGVPDYTGRISDPMNDFLRSKLPRTCKPEFFCNHDSYRENDSYPQTQPDMFLRETLPAELITHVNVGVPFDVSWGTRNSVFLMEWESCNWYKEGGGSWERQQTLYLVENLSNVPEWADEGSEVFEDLLRKTRIMVYGITDEYYE